MRIEKNDLLLYAVTDRAWIGEGSLVQQVTQALQGGATFVQLREKDLEADAFLEEAVAIRDICRKYRVPFVINDNVEIALQADADGVHLGQGDMELLEARKILGEDKIIGISAHTVEEALRAQQEGADYLGAGAVFATGTKTDVGNMSYKTLQSICSCVQIPVVAIGGINRGNVMQLQGSGISGIAVVSAIFGAQDIRNAASDLKSLAQKVCR